MALVFCQIKLQITLYGHAVLSTLPSFGPHEDQNLLQIAILIYNRRYNLHEIQYIKLPKKAKAKQLSNYVITTN